MRPIMQNDAITVTLLVTTCLEKLGVSYFIGGSIASTLYGMVRTTQDSDIIADLQMAHALRFVNALRDHFYIDEMMIINAIHQRSSFNIIHRSSMFKVDIFLPADSYFTKMQFSRAKQEVVSNDPELKAWVTSPEDILLAKLSWYRLGGNVSERQWRDVIGILKVQKDNLDYAYLASMAQRLNLTDLFAKAKVQAGLT